MSRRSLYGPCMDSSLVFRQSDMVRQLLDERRAFGIIRTGVPQKLPFGGDYVCTAVAGLPDGDGSKPGIVVRPRMPPYAVTTWP